MSAIPAIALALACVALLVALEAFWLIRRLVRRMETVENFMTLFCRMITQWSSAAQDDGRTAEPIKRVN